MGFDGTFDLIMEKKRDKYVSWRLNYELGKQLWTLQKKHQF